MVSVHRVTQTSMTSATLRGLQASLGRTQDLQNQLSTGKRLNKPSDDPAGLATTMQLRAQQTQDASYLSTIDDANGRLSQADTALRDISKSLTRAKELMVRANSGSMDATSKQSISTELTAIRQSVMQAYNTTWGDRPVFGGTAPGAQAVDPADGSYVGDEADIVATIGRNQSVRTDVKGSDIGADALPALLAKAVDDITSGSPDVADDQDQLDAVLGKISTALGDVGARVNQIQTTKDRITNEQIDLTDRITTIESADLPETIMQLSSSQVAYQSALGAASKIIQTSLLDYLK